MEDYKRVHATLNRLAYQRETEQDLHKMHDFEEYALKDAYAIIKLSVCGSSAQPTISYERARYIALSWAWRQEELTGMPHNIITGHGARILFTALFMNERALAFVLDNDSATEFFKFKQYSQIVRATFDEYAEWISNK